MSVLVFNIQQSITKVVFPGGVSVLATSLMNYKRDCLKYGDCASMGLKTDPWGNPHFMSPGDRYYTLELDESTGHTLTLEDTYHLYILHIRACIQCFHLWHADSARKWCEALAVAVFICKSHLGEHTLETTVFAADITSSSYTDTFTILLTFLLNVNKIYIRQNL